MTTDKTKHKLFKIYDNEYQSLLKYPFKSKFKYFEKYIKDINPNAVKEPYIHDFRLKDAKKLSKPNFSNEPGCWECDLMFINYFDSKDNITKEQIYLVLINVNTRYLIVEPIKNKSYDELIDIFRKVIESQLDYESCIKTIKCDGESAFESIQKEIIIVNIAGQPPKVISNLTQLINNAFREAKRSDKEFYQDSILKGFDKQYIRRILEFVDMIDYKTDFEYYPIKWIINSSPYALAHKNVDAVIRTLRNAFGLDNRRLADNELMQQMVMYYNNTPHNSLRFKNPEYNPFEDYDEYIGSGLEPPPKQNKWIYYTPYQMQNDIDLEWKYIRKMRNKLQDINNKLSLKGLLTYKRGNIILIHLDKNKGSKMFDKRRRIFDEIAEFICYQNGNVICRLLKPYLKLTKKGDSYIPYEQPKRGRIAKTDYERAIIEIPIIYTKFVCSSYDRLSNDYIQYFGL